MHRMLSKTGRLMFWPLGFLLVAMAGTARPALTLVESDNELKHGRYEATLDFILDVDAPNLIGNDSPDLVYENVMLLSARRPLAEGAMLALPGSVAPRVADFSLAVRDAVAADGTPLGESQAAALVSLDVAQVGPIHALRVVVNEGLLAGDGPALGAARIDISGSLPASSEKGRSLAGDASVIIEKMFLNGADARVYTSEARPKGAPPAMPGPHRIGYAPGNRVIRVPASSVGAGGTGALSVSVLHHGSQVRTLGERAIGELWLYAPWRDTGENVTDSMFATPGSGAPSPVATSRPAFQTLAPAGTEVSIARSFFVRGNTAYERSVSAPLGSRITFPRFSAGGTPQAHARVIVDQLTDPTVTINAVVQGLSSLSNNPDHNTVFSLRGSATPAPGIVAPTLQWDGRVGVDLTTSVTLPAIPPAGDTITLGFSVPSSSLAIDIQALYSYTLEYQGLPRLGADGICRIDLPEDPLNQPRRVTIGGLAAGIGAGDLILLDVTNPLSPVVISNPVVFTQGGIRAIEFEAGGGAARFHAQLVSSVASVAGTPTEALPTPATGTLNGIYVRPSALAAALAPLLTLRGEGYTELEPQAAYNAYNGGQESAAALRDAIRAVIENASATVEFPGIVLVGHGSLDRQNLMGQQTGAQIPTFIEPSIEISPNTRIENSVDAPYGMLFGEDRMMDARVSRIPVRTAAELQAHVAKLIAYTENFEALRMSPRRAVVVVDNDPMFLGDATTWFNLWDSSGHDARLITLSSGFNGNAVRAELKAEMESTTSTMALMYIGHGNNNVWSSPSIFQTSDVPTVDTANRLPVVLSLTCLNNYYAAPGAAKSLGEAFITEPNRGAVAILSTCSVDFYFPQYLYGVLLMETIVNRDPYLLNPLSYRAMIAHNTFLSRYPAYPETPGAYLLFGDGDVAMTLLPANAAVNGWALF